MTLDSMVQDASSGLFVPPQSRRQVLPWADMNALAIPERLSQVSPDLISALAVLVAQGPQGSKLVGADMLGRLLATASLNPVTKLTQPYHSGDLVVHVVDSSAFFPTQAASLLPANAGGNTCVGLSIQGIVDATTIKLNNDCGGQVFNIGDYFVGAPIVTSFNNLFNSDVTDRAARLLGHVTVDSGNVEADALVNNSVGIYGKSASGNQHPTASVDNANQVHLNVRATADPPTVCAGFNFGPGAVVSVSIPAISGFCIDLLSWSSGIGNVSGAGAGICFVTVKSTGTGGSTLWAGHLGVPATVGDTNEIPDAPVRLVTQPGQGITLAWDINVPGGYGATINCAYVYK